MFLDAFTGNFTMSCFFPTSLGTNITDFSLIEHSPDEIDIFESWNGGVEIEFYTDQTYEQKVGPNQLFIGSEIYFSSYWNIEFGANFEVNVYKTVNLTDLLKIYKQSCTQTLNYLKKTFVNYSTCHEVTI